MTNTPHRINRTTQSLQHQLDRLERRLDDLDAERRQRDWRRPRLVSRPSIAPTSIYLCVISSQPSGHYAFGAVVNDPVPSTSRGMVMETTLNRTSIIALTEALELTKSRPVMIYTNVNYLADVIAHQRLPQWEKARWRDTTDAPRRNADLWCDPDLLEATTWITAASYVPDYFTSGIMYEAYQLARTACEEMEALR